MSESTDLIRRLDSAISTKSLHPEYARGLLREAREALVQPAILPPPVKVYDFPWEDDEYPNMTCDVCRGESGGAFVGVACSTLGALSIAFCDRCLGNHAEPAGMLSALISEAGGIENMAPWVHDLTAWHDGAYVSAADLPPLNLTEAPDEPT